MKTKKLVSIILTITMLMSLMASMCITASAEEATPLDSSFTGGTLENGNYYLTGNITLSEEIDLSNAELDLNGYVIDCSQLEYYAIEIFGNATIKDNSDTMHHFTEDANGKWVWDKTEKATTHTVTGGVITGTSSYAAIWVYQLSDFYLSGVNVIGCNGAIDIFQGYAYIDDCKFYGNDNSVLYSEHDCSAFNVSNSEFKYNYANKGAAYYGNGTALRMSDTVITNNTATQNGGALYLQFFQCLAEGTKITMADGTKKNIEDVECGDMVKTFDHEAGKLSSSEVYIQYEGEDKVKPFTLHFTNNIELDIAGCHDLLCKDTLKYVTLSDYNVEQFVGKEFYNATSNTWEKLLDVTYTNNYYNYYSIYTANHMNCIANDMLTVPDDVDFLLNIYELDENLKADDDVLKADIEKYGLFESHNKETEEYFNKSNAKYAYIVAGKGLKTIDKLVADFNSEFENNGIQLFSTAEELGTGIAVSTFSVFSNNIIQDNIIKNDDTTEIENVYLTLHEIYGKQYTIELDENAKNNNIGITLASGTGTIVVDTEVANCKSFFTSDKNYVVEYSTTNNGEIPQYTVSLVEGEMDSYADSGYYAQTAASEDKSGIIAFTTQLVSGFDYNNITEFGYYLYNKAAAEKATITKDTVTDLQTLEGWFYGFVKDIAVEDFAKTVVAKPYVKVGTDYYFGKSLSSNVNANKWLGKAE